MKPLELAAGLLLFYSGATLNYLSYRLFEEEHSGAAVALFGASIAAMFAGLYLLVRVIPGAI